jgi:hypothetical protein
VYPRYPCQSLPFHEFAAADRRTGHRNGALVYLIVFALTVAGMFVYAPLQL